MVDKEISQRMENMHAAANGGRKTKQYIKNGNIVNIRFNIVNNRRVMATYINLWNGKVRIGQTSDVMYGDKFEAMKKAEKLLLDNGYILLSNF